VEEMPRRAGDPAVLIAGSGKIEADLGWRPKYIQLDDIVRSAWEWHQQRYQSEPA
jgi:UDP-glucose 4-epimerase